MAPVLGYWDIRGIVEPIRYLLQYAGVEFEDKRYKIGPAPEYERAEWLNEKFTLGLDFPNLPYFIDGDVKLTQSTAILRYLGRKNNLIGQTEAELLRTDLLEQQVTDIRKGLIEVCYNSTDYEARREEHLKTLPEKVELVSKFLGDGQYVAGERLTYVDFLLYETLDFLRLFEPTCLDATANLKEYLTRIESLSAIEKYMKSDRFNRLPIFGPMASFGGQKE